MFGESRGYAETEGAQSINRPITNRHSPLHTNTSHIPAVQFNHCNFSTISILTLQSQLLRCQWKPCVIFGSSTVLLISQSGTITEIVLHDMIIPRKGLKLREVDILERERKRGEPPFQFVAV